jgi:hypothetical protein
MFSLNSKLLILTREKTKKKLGRMRTIKAYLKNASHARVM